jgi:two-component system cell cycle response regulator
LGEHILIADDSALLRRMIGDVLREQGWGVAEAATGRAALDMSREELPRVLLLAREMVDIDGLTVLDTLRADERTRDMPVVFVTGHTDAADLSEGLDRGAHDYVRKPVDPVELVARVRTALRLRALHDQLLELARTDVLTGLANRRHADEVLRATVASALRHGRDVCVIVADVDRFKLINDAHGHAVGDDVLRAVAVRLLTSLRDEDLAARWGGEEFLVLLPDVPDAASAAERLRAAVTAAPVSTNHDTLAVSVTASFGWAAWDGGESAEALVGRADHALYEAKEAGRDRVVAAAR